MGFFDSRIEGNVPQNGEFSGPDFELIPAGTQALAYIEDAYIDVPKDNGAEYISLKWRIQKPESIANRLIFQKLRIWDDDGKKRNRALMMLAAIDQNSGGVISAQSNDPDDALLAKALLNKPMLIKLDVWEIDGKSGNWVCAVAPKPEGSLPEVMPTPKKVNNDEIPF